MTEGKKGSSFEIVGQDDFFENFEQKNFGTFGQEDYNPPAQSRRS